VGQLQYQLQFQHPPVPLLLGELSDDVALLAPRARVNLRVERAVSGLFTQPEAGIPSTKKTLDSAADKIKGVVHSKR